MASDNTTVKRSGPPPIVFILLLLGLIGAAYWFFVRRPQAATLAPPPAVESPAGADFALLPSIPAGTTVGIDGSTSMAHINAALKAGFEQQYPGSTVNIAAAGSENGIQALLLGDIDVAASSRPLTPQEQSRGLTAVSVTNDRMALVVGNDNPYKRGLSAGQVAQIFQGQLNNWATLGGPDATIRVINRPTVSGTHASFKEFVLGGGEFGTTPNITTLNRDATTPMLQQLGTDGIGYATFSQVADQQTVRVVPIDGVTPEASNYPFQRQLYYVYTDANDPAVQAFLGFALSQQGQQAIASAGK
ncbi:MAG TPA: phosphate ABC transporter substrate-binding protein [Nodosilinea sp.]|nr:phosphate ABC transporter substrate-binding protein [Nodosilinea sp.]